MRDREQLQDFINKFIDDRNYTNGKLEITRDLGIELATLLSHYIGNYKCKYYNYAAHLTAEDL